MKIAKLNLLVTFVLSATSSTTNLKRRKFSIVKDAVFAELAGEKISFTAKRVNVV